MEQAVSDADLIIEAVPEKIELKKEIWSTVGKAAPAKTILTTNTSTLRPSEFREATGCPGKFLALHFANWIRVNQTAEVTPTDRTDENVPRTVVEYAKEMGMLPVELKKEHPGYILNSLLVPFLDAATELWMNDIADPAEIDRDWRISLVVSHFIINGEIICWFYNVAYQAGDMSKPAQSRALILQELTYLCDGIR